MASKSRKIQGESSPVGRVQIDGLVVLKIIKHCEEETSTTGPVESAQGVLLGLLVEDSLEITNCFPFPKNTDDAEFDEVQYQMEMMRNLRHVNIDHLHVGWYQSAYFGSFLNKAWLESQFNYQHSIEESVVLIYDPEKTRRGSLYLKAYRLTPKLMEIYKDSDFSPEIMKQANMTFEKVYDEIPLVIKNSHLISSMLCEIGDMTPQRDSVLLNLATDSVLTKNVRLLMSCVDNLCQELNRYSNYQRSLQKQQYAKQQYLHRRQQENATRVSKGEKPLPDEDINKVFKPISAPGRLDSLLLSGQVKHHCEQINHFSSQSFGKLFMAEALQPKEDV